MGGRIIGMEPMGVEFWNERTGETVYAADVIDASEFPTDLDRAFVISWDEKGNAHLDELD